ncbi:hypothetical protein FS837_011522 [Tulasnella sp. UAMH 9824]|nr:hypothetical protein FS837_011522 [Tulasnella sp. UAMH 9824]
MSTSPQSSSADEAQEHVLQTSHEPVSVPLDFRHLQSMQVDPDSDSDDSMLEWAKASSWHSAESDVDHGDENLHTSPPPPVIEDDDPYADADLDAAISQLSMDDLARIPGPDRGRREDSADNDDAMSVSDIDDTSDANPDASWFAAANASGATMDSNADVEHEESIEATILLSLVKYDYHGEVRPMSHSSPVNPSLKSVLQPYFDIAPASFSVIVHSKMHNEWFDKYDVPWSAQWQLAVMDSNGKKKLEDITEQDIQELSGTNTVVGPKVLRILFPNEGRRAPGDPARSRLGNPFVELDREEAALNKGAFDTLGLCSRSDDTADLGMGTWWGGRIEQRAVMVKNTTAPKSMCNGDPASNISWGIRLFHHAVKGKSCRFTRKFGSRRFIQLAIPDFKKLTREERNSLKKELFKPHLLHGRIFRAFSAHDGTVRLIETDEDYERVARPEVGDSRRLSFRKFLDWFNPLERNATQASHLSTSHDHGQGSPDAKHVMNDGCGLISHAALRLIQRQKDLQNMPTALQGRIAGAKGLWILNPDDRGSRPQIWLTKSQVKIHYNTDELDEDPSRRIFDLLRVSQVKESVRLPMHPIINFAHNGIPHTVFSELLQESLKSKIDQVLEDWKSDDAVAMWSMVFNRSGVGNIRKRRYDRFAERTFGNFRDTEEREENLWTSEGFTSFGDINNVVDSGPDPNSGWPSNFAEQIIELLEAGFIPSKCAHLAALMKSYLKMEVEWITREYRIPLNRSAEVFAAPDFSRTLKPGEVYFRSSRHCALVDDDDMIDGTFNGHMIIFRNPTKTPSDARLVRAVDYPQLRELQMFFFSQFSERDLKLQYWLVVTMMVTPFADPPDGFKEHLETAVRPGSEVLTIISSMNEAESIRELQMVLLDDVTRENRCGLYSNMSDSATFMYGPDSDKTHYLSYMYFNELDAGKSGRHVKKKTWEKDQKEFRHLKLPACMKKAARGQQKKAKTKPEESDSPRSEEIHPPRSEDLGPFVLNVLKPFSKEQEDEYMRLINGLNIDADADYDPALLAPLHDAESRARQLQDEGRDGMGHELKKLKCFVEMNRESWAKLFGYKDDNTSNVNSRPVPSGSQDSTYSRDPGFVDLPRTEQIQQKRKVSEEFWNGFKFQSQLKHFSEGEARRVMCSYAYHHAWEKAQVARRREGKGSFEYAFNVAFKTLAELKGKAHGGLYSTCVEPFHDLMVPRRGILDEGRM